MNSISKAFAYLIDKATGRQKINWSRVVMQERCRELIEKTCPGKLDALEISGSYFSKFGFKSYKSANYPEYDICSGILDRKYDIIIAEQVFEHLLWPYRAGRNVYEMLNPGGYFLISTPFFVRIHNYPVDCSRWTETGLKYLLAECGFDLNLIQTGSWGNRRCVVANLDRWVPFRSRIHSLVNEPDYPFHVWALAQKALAVS